MVWLKFVLSILFFLFGILFVVFALSNRENLIISLFPFSLVVEGPVYMVLFVVLFVGTMIGGMATWLSASQARRRHRAQERHLIWLRAKLGDGNTIPETSLLSSKKVRADIRQAKPKAET